MEKHSSQETKTQDGVKTVLKSALQPGHSDPQTVTGDGRARRNW